MWLGYMKLLQFNKRDRSIYYFILGRSELSWNKFFMDHEGSWDCTFTLKTKKKGERLPKVSHLKRHRHLLQFSDRDSGT